MSTIDVVARLRLNAEQFASENGKAFANMAANAKRVADEIPQSFSSAFAGVQATMRTALAMPRTAGGSLDLSGEITQLRASAAASQNNAIAAREMESAARAAALAETAEGEALMIRADAAMVAALAADRAATSDLAQVRVLEALQLELGATASATTRAAMAHDTLAHGSGRASIAQFELMHVIRASSDAFAAGAPLSQIFSMEIGRIGEAAALTGGGLGALGKFFGTYGIAITAVTALASPFIGRLFDTASATQETADALKKAETAADAFGTAETLLGKVIDLTTGKLKTHNEALLENVRLQAESMRLTGQADEARARAAIAKIADPTFSQVLSLGSAGGFGQHGDRPGAAQAQLDAAARIGSTNAPLGALRDDILGDKLTSPTEIRKRVDAMVQAGQLASYSSDEILKFKTLLESLPTARQNIKEADKAISVLDGGPIPAEFKPYARDKKPKKDRKPPDRNREAEGAAEEIARINAEWDDQPKLIDKARVETLKLNDLIKDLERRKPPGFEKLIAGAKADIDLIANGLTKPYDDYIKSQKESLAVQQLVLQGRDAEASALQEIFRLKGQMKPLDDAQLANVLKTAEQQERIARAIEDQRRVVGIVVGAVDNLHRTFDNFLSDIDGSTGSALKNLAGGILNDFKSLQRDILSNALFGGIDRDIEKYVRQLTGKKTPAEIIEASATDAASELDKFAANVRRVTDTIGGHANDNQTLAALFAKGNGVTGPGPYGNGQDGPDIVVTGHTAPAGADAILRATDVFGVIAHDLVGNFEHLFGKLPKDLEVLLEKGLPKALEGISFGQLGGSIFSSITGGKDNKLASGIGGALGEVAGKAIGKTVGDSASGLLKSLGGAAGPIGAIVGGVLGDLVGGLFQTVPKGQAGVTVNQYGTLSAGVSTGSTADARAGASTLAGAVSQGLQSIADQLGAKITGSTDVQIGTYKGELRVNDHGGAIGGVSGSGAIAFTSEEDAISYAISDALKDGVLSGISAASLKILQSGEDLQRALTKALDIESIPKRLKTILDPVGEAIDELNAKWQKTVDALKEGGATADQMAQAQQLYNLELTQTKNSTAGADQALKDFQKSLKLGTDSPYSLRDQEATASSALAPFLDQINAGQTIDQGKYQSAAQDYLDVERQLYGSTEDYFKALDSVQAATNKAISSIDNATPIGTPVADPFASATANNTASAVSGIQTGNEIASQTNDLLNQVAGLLAQVAANTRGGGTSDFIGTARVFLKTG